MIAVEPPSKFSSRFLNPRGRPHMVPHRDASSTHETGGGGLSRMIPDRVAAKALIVERGRAAALADLERQSQECPNQHRSDPQGHACLQGRGRPWRKSAASSGKLWHALHAISDYLTGQSHWLVNYAKRYRAGLRVGTSITEGTANFLVNRRMNKSQQMRWSRRGADLLLQVRCAVYNGALGNGFRRPFDPESCQQLAKAA